MANKKDIQNFQVRIPYELWLFLKEQAAKERRHMITIIIECLEKYRKKVKKNVDND